MAWKFWRELYPPPSPSGATHLALPAVSLWANEHAASLNYQRKQLFRSRQILHSWSYCCTSRARPLRAASSLHSQLCGSAAHKLSTAPTGIPSTLVACAHPASGVAHRSAHSTCGGLRSLGWLWFRVSVRDNHARCHVTGLVRLASLSWSTRLLTRRAILPRREHYVRFPQRASEVRTASRHARLRCDPAPFDSQFGGSMWLPNHCVVGHNSLEQARLQWRLPCVSPAHSGVGSSTMRAARAHSTP